MRVYHKPVLVNEILNFIPKHVDNISIIDGTLGEGGHTEIIAKTFENSVIYGVDRDVEILEIAKQRLASFENIHYINSLYSEIDTHLPKEAIKNIDFMLLDLGVSMFHFIASNRSFSYRESERLDMRLTKGDPLSAYEVINSYDYERLDKIFREYGEITYSRQLAKSICDARVDKPIESAIDFEEIVYNTIPRNLKGISKREKAKAFQAIRIEVNDELEVLKKALNKVEYILKPKGLIAIISYHSLEDRIVKRFSREKSTKFGDGTFDILNKHVIIPLYEERKNNVAARSAKMRLLIKT